MTRPYNPDRHRPHQACERCGEPWPCRTEQQRLAAQARAREAVARAKDAAAYMKAVNYPGNGTE